MWYRIELDKSGAILTCTEVESVVRSGRLVRFIEAGNKAEACSLAKDWWQLQLRRANDTHQRKRAARMAAGTCSECDRVPAEGKRLCGHHAQLGREAMRERAQRRKGGDMSDRRFGTRTPEERMAHAQERAVKVSRILREFDTRGPVAFRAWLLSLGARSAQPMAEAAE